MNPRFKVGDTVVYKKTDNTDLELKIPNNMKCTIKDIRTFKYQGILYYVLLNELPWAYCYIPENCLESEHLYNAKKEISDLLK